jgi:hypothetical protein
MTSHMQLTLALWFAGIMGFGALSFMAWLTWTACWHAYDYFMQQRWRRQHSRFDGARSTERHAFRDHKGVMK